MTHRQWYRLRHPDFRNHPVLLRIGRGEAPWRCPNPLLPLTTKP